MRLLLTILAVSQACLFSVYAGTVGWSADQQNALALANGTLANGDSILLTDRALLRLGYFTISDSAIANNFALGNFQAISDSFREYGTARVGDGYNMDGVWSTSSVNADPTFWEQRIHIWAYDTSTAAAATQWGIFTNTTTNLWLFPTDDPIPASTNIDLSQVPTNTTGVIVGSFGPPNDPVFGNPTYKMAALVPEPTSLLLGAFGLVALCSRRWRA